MNKIYLHLLGGWEANMLTFNHPIWEGEENDVTTFINSSSPS